MKEDKNVAIVGGLGGVEVEEDIIGIHGNGEKQ